MRLTAPLLVVSILALSYGQFRPALTRSHAAPAVLLEPDHLTPLKLVFMGSSVPEGTGATNHHGYVADYFDVLPRPAFTALLSRMTAGRT